MLVEVERAFNHIYRARSGRSWARRITMYWTLLTLGMILLFATFFVGERFKGWIASVAAAQGIGSGSFILAAIGFMVTVAISLLLLVFAYIAVPNARVHVRTALAGAFVAAVVWEASKWAFTQYISFSGSSRYSALYGSLAMIPVSLLWIYLTWLIVLLGLQVSYGLQMFGTWRQVTHRREQEEELVDPLAVLPLMVYAARRFEKGKSFDASDVSEQLAIPSVLAERLLEGLAQADHLNRVDGDRDAYALIRPPSETPLAALLKLAQEISVADRSDRCDSVISEIRRAEISAAGDRTLQSLLDHEPR
jgi:membrane protein